MDAWELLKAGGCLLLHLHPFVGAISTADTVTFSMSLTCIHVCVQLNTTWLLHLQKSMVRAGVL